uniref:Uncharacterized protein n=1 Tax=Anguilla anguilla TaxID=7936 RepID=A0A0E9WBE3_ANGAN
MQWTVKVIIPSLQLSNTQMAVNTHLWIYKSFQKGKKM